MPSIKKALSFVLTFAFAASALCTSVMADQPYEGYQYDWWGDPVPSQTGYVVDRVISGLDIGTAQRYNSEEELKQIADQFGLTYFSSRDEYEKYKEKRAEYVVYEKKLKEYNAYLKSLDKYNEYLEKLQAYEDYLAAKEEADKNGTEAPKKVNKPKEVKKPDEVAKPTEIPEVKEVKESQALTKEVVIGALSNPEDLFIDPQTELLYITDGGNNRIIVTDLEFKNPIVLDYFYNPKTKKYESLNQPHGYFVRHDNNALVENERTMCYIADYNNSRVLATYGDGSVFMEYLRPSSEFYESDVTFLPNKVVADVAGNVYVNIKSITDGAVMFAPDGSFSGYFGANRVQMTAQAIANKFWKTILSREAAKSFIQAVPMEFSNFDIDAEGFIYTVTEGKSATTDVFKKMNPAGENVLINLGFSDYIYGDKATYYYNVTRTTYGSSINDVDVDENGTIRLLDQNNRRIFEYTDECELLFIYGGNGAQKGLFNSVKAIEAYNNVVYVLDSGKSTITTFVRTEFGDIVHNAMSLYTQGKYEESQGPWEEVLTRDSNYWFAYIGLGNAALSQGDYTKAMDYFYRNSKAGYNRAFKQYRMEFIRDNFNIIMIVVFAIIVICIGMSVLKKKLKARKKAGGSKK